MFGLLPRRVPVSRKKRTQRRDRPVLEPLENRLVPTVWDYTHLVQVIGGYPHAGPTHLYLNFDGKDNITPYFNTSSIQTSKDIQEIIFRTSEVFAPFNVQVSEMSGQGNYDSGSDGNTTVFIGSDPSNMNNGVKFSYSHTEAKYSDYPGFAKYYEHTPNSDDHDIAYVDPYSNTGLQSTTAIVRSIAHEAGHTFGLSHIRTDVSTSNPGLGFLTDPALLPTKGSDNQGTVSAVMSYTDTNSFFANQTFPTTGWNNFGSSTTLDRLDLIPKWWKSKLLGIVVDTDDVVTENTFTYLTDVLGSRPAEPGFHVANAGSLDPGVVNTFVPQADTLGLANHLSATGSILNTGDFDVNQWTAPSNQTLRVNVTATGGLLPVLQVYGSDKSVSVFFDTDTQNIPVKKNVTYRFVVGSYSGLFTGSYTIQLSTLSINGDADFSPEDDVIRLVRDYAQPGLLDVFINNATPTPNFSVTFSTLTFITIDGKGGNDTIILDMSNGPVVPSGGVEVHAGSGVDDHLNVIGPPKNELYTVLPGVLNIQDALGLITFDTIETLDVTGGDKNDTFDVRATDAGTRVQLHGGGGSDSFYVDNDGYQTSAGMVKTVRSEVDIDGGGGGKDSLTLNDISDPVPVQVTVTFNSIGAALGAGDDLFGTGGRLYYEALTQVDINLGASERGHEDGNRVYVLSTAAGTPVHINTGKNGDIIYVGAGRDDTRINGGDGRTGSGPPAPSGDVSGIRSEVTIDGQDGADLLEVLDNESVQAKQVTLTAGDLGAASADTFFAPGGKLIYVSIATLDVNMGSGGNKVNVRSTNADTMTTLHTGAADDAIIVSSKAPSLGGDLAGIAGSLTVDVGGGAGNLLLVSDRNAVTGNQAAGVTGGLITGFAGPNDDVPIWFTGTLSLGLQGADDPGLAETYYVLDPLANLSIHASGGKDTVNVRASHLPVNIYADNGDDTVVLGSSNNSLDPILGPVRVYGGQGIDVLQINDQGSPGSHTYDVGAQSVARSGAGVITFNNLESLVLRTGFGASQVNVQNLPNTQLTELLGGPSNDDRLAGPDQANTWDILGTANAGRLDTTLHFAGIENLTGATKKDTFVVANGSGLAGKIDGGGGTSDTLDYSGWSQSVTFDLANFQATGLGSFAGIERLMGSGVDDTLRGPALPNNIWKITGIDAGQVSTLALGIVDFSSVENLRGGAALDVYQFGSAGRLSGSLVDLGGTNTLDYSAFPATMPVIVDLQQGSASRVNGMISGIVNVTGGHGDDILLGNDADNLLQGQSGNDILVGRGGKDTIYGENGNDILIGGLGADLLDGGTGDDLLIGGATSSDADPQAAALSKIMAEWTSNDSYANRRKYILGQLPNGLNNGFILSSSIAPDDLAVDQLTGGSGTDWFWASISDLVDLAGVEKNQDQP